MSKFKPLRKLVMLLLILTSQFSYSQQDPLYSQYQFNQLMINPAYAGVYDRFSAGLISRFQWAGIDGAPTTNTFTIQSTLKAGQVGLGAVILNDRFGISDNYEIQLSSSYNIQMRNAKLAMGLQGGLIRYGFNFNNVEMDYLDDPEVLNGQESFQQPNFGLGMMYMSEKFFFGASVPRILSVSTTDGSTQSERYKKHYYFTGGFVAENLGIVKLKVVSMVRSIDEEGLSADLILSANLDEIFWTGISIRNLKQYGLFLNMMIANHMRLGYSFELPSSSLILGNYGTHEISFLIEFGVKGNKVKRYF